MTSEVRSVLLAATLALAAAVPADAATVEFKTQTLNGAGKNPYDFYTVTTVVVEAAPGEASAISARVAGTRLVLSDAAASLTASTGCSQVGDGAVDCPLPDELTGQLRDGNDSFAVDPGFAGSSTLRGGPGDDVIESASGADSLFGGGGRDVLRAGPGKDTLADEDGSVRDGDVLDGGEGRDSVSFADQRSGMAVDLAQHLTSEGDTLNGIEGIGLGPGDDRVLGTAESDSISVGLGRNVVDGSGGDDSIYGDGELRGGTGDDSLECEAAQRCTLSGGEGRDSLRSGNGADSLYGGPGNDDLTGLGGDDLLVGGSGNDRILADFAEGVPGAGNDVLRGGPGNDRLYGGPGRDRIDAGPGADAVLSLDRAKDAVDCGGGNDRLMRDRHDPPRPASCERVQLGATLALDSDAEYERDGSLRGVAIGVSCPNYAIGRCRGVAEAFDRRRRRLGRARYAIEQGSRLLDIRFDAAGRRLLRRGTTTLIIRVHGGDGTGGSSVVSRRYRIRVR